MAEDSENIGGISVSVGASHAQLQADLAEANRILDQWAKQIVNVRVGAQVQQPTQQQTARAVPPPTVSVGPGAATRTQAAQAQTALQRAINAELAKTGEHYNDQTGEIEKATAAAQKQRTVITQSATQISRVSEQVKPISLEVDTAGLRAELDAVLAKFRQITEEARKLATVPTTPKAPARTATTGGTRPPRKPPTAMAAGGEEDEEGISPQRLDPRPRIVNTRLATTPKIVVTPAQKQAEKTALRNAAAEQKRDRDRTLRELSYEAEREGPGGPTSTTLIGGPRRTPAEIEAFRRQEAQRANAQAPRVPRQAPVVATVAAPTPPIDDIERQRRRLLANIEANRGRGGGTGPGSRGLGEEDIERRAEQRIAASESARVAAGRTARTTASGFGGQFLFGGPARQQAEAVARQAEAEQNLIRIRRLATDPKIIGDARAYRQIIEEQTVAENTLAKATEKVQSFASPGTALRSLAAVTVAGAAFGLVLKGIDVAVSTVVPALGDAIDQAAGFGATSTKVTGALAQQTIAMRGNASAVLATAEAQAGLSTAAADVVNSQIQMTTQIKAGALAAAQAGGLFRAAIGANQQAPQGLLGGFGGILGGPIFAQQLGGGAGLAETVKSSFGDITGANRGIQAESSQAYRAGRGLQNAGAINQATTGELTADQRDRIAQLAKDRIGLETTYNDAAKRGAGALGVSSSAVVHFAQITDAQAQAIQNSNLPDELKDLASKSREGLLDASGNLITAYKQAADGLKQVGVGLGIPDAETLGRIALFAEQQRQRESAAALPAIQSQQAFVRPSVIAAAGRQQQYSLGTQIPAQAGLQALASPLQPVGTGLVAANAAEQKKITAGQQQSVELQKQLNDYYAQGKQILIDTYKVPPQLIASVEQVGQQIAATQASISNEQAAYQVAQYNFQLMIARRTLSDISGLTGHNFGVAQSELGVLEKQNLALSRQGQQLQFALSQRQINFQVALAGFQAPGVTPEERQARIAEAKTEASFAQKQLDIQRQMFGNQVKIVDISNLRQGADLVKQIGLLTQGRQVTVDTHLAEEKLLRLQALQQKNVAQVGTYLAKVDSLAAAAFGEIQQLEAAAGHAMINLAQQVLTQYGIVIKGITDFANGGSTKTGAGGGTLKPTAAGGIFQTQGPTVFGDRVVGEANGEMVAILSHPRAMSNMGGGAGGSVTVNFNGDMVIRNEADMDLITRKVVQAMGREASLKGLRGVG